MKLALIQLLLSVYFLVPAAVHASSSDSSESLDSDDSDDDGCSMVYGTIVSTVTEVGCAAGQICTEGNFFGDIKGTFMFKSASLAPFSSVFPDDANALMDIAATTGSLELYAPNVCDGLILVSDGTAFSLLEDGFFGSIQRITGGTGGCHGVTGTLLSSGIFMNGCVDCQYQGKVCVYEHY